MGRSPRRRVRVGRLRRAQLGRSPARGPGGLMRGAVATGALSRGRRAQPRHHVQASAATLRPVGPTGPVPLGRRGRLDLHRPDRALFPAPPQLSVPPEPVPPGSPVTRRQPKARAPGGDPPAMLRAVLPVGGPPVGALPDRVGVALRRPAVAARVPPTTGPQALAARQLVALTARAASTRPNVRPAVTTASLVMTAAPARLRPVRATTVPVHLRGARPGRVTTGHPSGQPTASGVRRPEAPRVPTHPRVVPPRVVPPRVVPPRVVPPRVVPPRVVPPRAAIPGPRRPAGVLGPTSIAGRRGRPSPSCRSARTPPTSTTTCCVS
jgi:hypothetical protein